jgi:hypothetical protein
MQTLNIGGHQVLTFYDSGANTHLVDGEMAEQTKFTVLDPNSACVNVVRGGQVYTSYGLNSCILGPDAQGEYPEIECQGLDAITAPFPTFQLKPLIKEASEVMPPDTFYPLTVGGD